MWEFKIDTESPSCKSKITGLKNFIFHEKILLPIQGFFDISKLRKMFYINELIMNLFLTDSFRLKKNRNFDIIWNHYIKYLK